MASREVNRREFLAGAAGAGLAAMLPALAFAQSKTLVAATFPGTWSEAHRNLLAPYFKKRTGASVTQSIQLATDQLAKLAAAKGGRFPGRFGRLSDSGVPQFGMVSSTVLASVAMVPVLREVRRVDHLQHPGVHVRDHRRDPLRLLGAGPYQVARPGQPRDPHTPLRTRCHRRSGGDRVLRALRRLVAQPGEDLLIESSHSSSERRSSSAFPSTSLSAPTTEPLPVPLCRT